MKATARSAPCDVLRPPGRLLRALVPLGRSPVLDGHRGEFRLAVFRKADEALDGFRTGRHQGLICWDTPRRGSDPLLLNAWPATVASPPSAGSSRRTSTI